MNQEFLCSDELPDDNIIDKISQSDIAEKDYRLFDCSFTFRETQNSNNIFDNITNNSKEGQQSSQNFIYFSSNDTNNLDENNNTLENQNECFNIIKENDININDDIFYNNNLNLNLLDNQQLSQNLFDIQSNETNNLNKILENPKEKININNENDNINNDICICIKNENQISKKRGRKKKEDLKEGKTHDKSENGNINKKIVNKIHNCIINKSNEIILNEFGIQTRKFRKIDYKIINNISTKQKIKEFLDLNIKDFLKNDITTKFKNISNNKNEETLKFFLENKKEKYKNNQKLNHHLEMEIKTFYKEIFLNLEYENFIKLEECKLKEKNENNPKYIQKLKKMTENFIEDNYYLSKKRKNNSLFITNNEN